MDFDGPYPDQDNPHYRGLGRCFLWQGAKDTNGYGVTTVDERQVKTHRLAYAIQHGELQGDFCVCHHCDNPSCVNPFHLFLGSHRDNAQDRQRKQRGNPAVGDRNGSRTKPECRPRGDKNGSHIHVERRAYGDRNGLRTHPECVKRGESSYFAVLNADVVRQIIALRKDGVSQQEIAERFGVTQSNISSILRGATWSHLPEVKEFLLIKNTLPTLRAKGDRVSLAKLDDDKIREIFSLYRGGTTSTDIGKKFGVDRHTVMSIIRRKTWKHVIL